jgi:hypothetical protein
MKEQLDFKFESPEERRKRLVESIKKVRATPPETCRKFTEEENKIIEDEDEENRRDIEQTYR